MLHETKENTLAGYQTMYATVAAIGIGSMLFHGTLTVWGQQLDELPMVWHLLISMYIINRGPLETTKRGKLFLSIGLCLYGLIFSIAHVIFRTTTAFQVHFGTLLVLLLVRVYHRFRNVQLTADATKILILFLSSGTIGFGMWLLDYHHCDFMKSSFFGFNPQLHSFWHLFMGYFAFSSVVLLKILDNAHVNQSIQIKYIFGIPFAYRIKSDDVTPIKQQDIESMTPLF